MGRSSVVPGVVKPLPFPIGKVARIDLKISDASLSSDEHSIALSDDMATRSRASSCVSNRKRIKFTFESGDVDGIDPLTLRPEFLYRNP